MCEDASVRERPGRVCGNLFVGQQPAKSRLVPLGLCLFRGDETGWFGSAYALAGHFADDLRSGKDFFLWLARHGSAPDIQILPAKKQVFATLTMTNLNESWADRGDTLSGPFRVN